MATCRIEVSAGDAHRLEELAKEKGITPEELLRLYVSALLNKDAQRFHESSKYVLEKNAQLYSRLTEKD